MFTRNTSPQFSGLTTKPNKKPDEQVASPCCLLLLVSCLAYSSTLKMEVLCCPEMSGADNTQNQIFLTNAGVNTNIKLNKNKNPCLGRFNMKPELQKLAF
jgi:hypothetical protein